MTWTAPYTPVPGTAYTAAQLLTYVFNNLNETAPGKATTAGRYFVATGPNAIAEREMKEASIDGSVSTNDTSFTHLGGPLLAITTGARALVFINSRLDTDTSGFAAIASFECDGSDGDDSRQLRGSNNFMSRAGISDLYLTTAGDHTFEMKYRTSTGGASNATFAYRQLIVMAL